MYVLVGVRQDTEENRDSDDVFSKVGQVSRLPRAGCQKVMHSIFQEDMLTLPLIVPHSGRRTHCKNNEVRIRTYLIGVGFDQI